MKKFFSIIALSAMTLSLSSFDNNEVIENPHDDCVAEANAHGEFMDDHDGRSGASWALEFYTTFCLHQQ